MKTEQSNNTTLPLNSTDGDRSLHRPVGLSDTPRTDAEYLFKARVSENPCDPNEHSEWMTSLCRELERENRTFRNAMKICEHCDSPTKAKYEELKCENANLREALFPMLLNPSSPRVQRIWPAAAARARELLESMPNAQDEGSAPA